MCIKHLARFQKIKATLFILFSILCISPVRAQFPEDLLFKNFSIEQGLSDMDVKAIIQGSNGYIWIGAMDGLNRYDGYEFKYFQHNSNDSSSISGNSVWSLYEDHLNNLWVGTAAGLNLFNRQLNSFTRFQHDDNDSTSISNNTIFCINEDSNGNIWFGSYFGGLNLYDRKTGAFKHFQHHAEDSLSLSHNSVRVIFFDSQNTMWVGTPNGLNKFDEVRQTFTRYKNDPDDANSISSNHVNSIAEDSKGMLWFGTRGQGINKFDKVKNTFTRYFNEPNNASTISSNGIRKIFKDSKGNLWVGTIKGLSKLNPLDGSFDHFQHSNETPNSLINDIVKEISEDTNGNLWIGTYLGVSLISNKKKQINHFRPENKKSKFHKRNWIWSIAEDDNGNLWVGSWDGLFQYDKDKIIVNYYNSNDPIALSAQNIHSLHTDEQGIIWIGTYSGGLNKYDPKTKTIKYFKNDPLDPNSISDNVARCLMEDKFGNLWIGTAKGLNKMDKTTGKFTRFYADPANQNSLQNDIIWSLFEDKNGIIWIGTSGGLHQYNPTTESFSMFDHNPGKPNSSVHDIVQSPEGNLLFVGSGLSYLELESGKLSQFNRSDGILNSDVCSCALFDDNGFIWVADGKGILKIDTETRESRRFDHTDGVLGWSFNNSSCYKSSDGTLYFGGNDGFNSFHPDSIIVSGYMPPIGLTKFQLFNKDVPLIHQVSDSVSSELIYTLPKTIGFMEQLTLPYNAFVMSFEYASMDFASSEKNEYMYILENFDREWNKLGNQRKATYTNLSPGEYVFKVMGTNNDGVWSNREIKLPITILPPWWLTWWMKTIYWVLGIGIPLGMYKKRVADLKKRSAELEQQVLERTSEVVQQKEEIQSQAEELKDTNEKLVALDAFKEGMTGMIVHDLKNPLNGIINVPKSYSFEKQILRTKQIGKQMLNMVLNILDVHKYEETKMIVDKLDCSLLEISLDAINEVAFLADQKNIAISNTIRPETNVKADKEIVDRIFVNILTNAIKYTPNNGSISLSADIGPNRDSQVYIEITDTGQGIPKEQIARVFDKFGQVSAKKSGKIRSTGLGLTFCKIAVAAHGGKIGVKSEQVIGATFWFTLPMGKIGKSHEVQKPVQEAKHSINSLLTQNDKQILEPFVIEFKKHEIYDISILRKLLKQVETVENERIKNWKESMNKAIGSGNEMQYNELINETLEK